MENTKKEELQKIFQEDPNLIPHKQIFEEIYKREEKILDQINNGFSKGLDEFSRAYEYYGIYETEDEYVIREWLPEAKSAFFMGDFNFWNRNEHIMSKDSYGVFTLTLSKSRVKIEPLSHIKLYIHGSNGKEYDRNMAYARYCTQDKDTHAYCQRYVRCFKQTKERLQRGNSGCYRKSTPLPPQKNEEKIGFMRMRTSSERPEQLLIYECHVGMSSEFGKVASYEYFTKYRLPYIKGQGYTAIQLMAIQEHSYYASFGYQVTNFFAPSSRFGTPCEFKNLVDKAHELGLKVIIDIVLSHANANSLDGIGDMDGSGYQYFHEGDQGTHSVWGSKLFNYSKFEVLRFLCSNVRYWIEEFGVDGFRLDAITSLLYKHHGIGVGFTGEYHEYFQNDVLDLVIFNLIS